MRLYQAPFLSSIEILDGRLDKAPWTSCPWSEDFVDIEGDIRPLPRFRTRMKMFWSSDGLYIGAEMEEPHVWGTLTERDSVIFHDNDFEVFLDPDNDGYAYAELEINALNTVWDLLLIRPYREQGRGVDGWDIQGLRTAVHVDGTVNDPSDTDKGWSVEICIPWHALWEISKGTVPPEKGDQWKINFSRVQWMTDVVDGQYVKREGLKEDNWVWSPQGVVDMHVPSMWGLVEFVTE
ncbi:MAG TPA: carbohydrate-binding family 9-like protein [Fimbriimonas sp.]|nr:carbohydrate-binding family 9-like protein [Fimbriimonas sp.]